MNQSTRPIDRPQSLGEELQRLRGAAGVSLDEIVAETKVSRRIFEALEEGRYQFLPEKVFCKNFLRQYIEIVGGDAGLLIEGFDRAWDRFQEASGSFAVLKVESPPTPHTSWWVWLPFLLAGIVVATLVIITIRGSDGPEHLPPDPRRSAADRPGPQLALSTPTPLVEDDQAPKASEEAEEGRLVIATLRVGHGKECWIHYRDRNGQVGEALLRGGEATVLELEGPVLLTIGNADAATIEIGGREYGKLGKPGEVVRFLVDENGLTPFAGDPRDG
jgi:cytoskeletal protein RodZ